jgi:hypothetical protein
VTVFFVFIFVVNVFFFIVDVDADDDERLGIVVSFLRVPSSSSVPFPREEDNNVSYS